MSNIFLFLLLCSVGLSVASLITPKAFFVALPQRRTRLKGFLFWCLTGNAFFLAFSLAMDAEAGKNVHGPTLIACILLLGCLPVWLYRLRRPAVTKAPSLSTDNKENTESKTHCTEKHLPDGNILHVASRSILGQTYVLDLDTLTCTCQDWQKRRSDQPGDNPERLCKHLVSALLDKPDLLPPNMAVYYCLLEPMAREGRGMPAQSDALNVHYGIRQGIPFVLTHEPGSPWANVTMQGQRYGYSPEERRWSYGRTPEDATFWAKYLNAFINNE